MRHPKLGELNPVHDGLSLIWAQGRIWERAWMRAPDERRRAGERGEQVA